MTELVIKIYKYFHNHRPIFWASMIFLFIFFGFFASRINLEEDINRLNEDLSFRDIEKYISLNEEYYLYERFLITFFIYFFKVFFSVSSNSTVFTLSIT